MARKVANAKLDTRTARAKLASRREPYWAKLAAGCYVGYRRSGATGSWVARMRGDDDGKQHYLALGAADDALDADGSPVLTFAGAQEKARAFFTAKARELDGHEDVAPKGYTVEMALDAYFKTQEARRPKGVYSDRSYANTRIVPTLGSVPLAKLTAQKIRAWHEGLAAAPKLLRTKPGAARNMADVDADDPDAIRARQASANRILTVLKAALNQAFRDGKVADDSPWRKSAPFRDADSAVVRFLSGDECSRIVAACPSNFGCLVKGALLTGCRFGELVRFVVSDFNAMNGSIHVRQATAGQNPKSLRVD